MTQNEDYIFLDCCCFWHIAPDEMEKKDDRTKAKMFAFFLVKQECEAYYNSEQMKNMKSDKPLPHGKTFDPRRN